MSLSRGSLPSKFSFKVQIVIALFCLSLGFHFLLSFSIRSEDEVTVLSDSSDTETSKQTRFNSLIGKTNMWSQDSIERMDLLASQGSFVKYPTGWSWDIRNKHAFDLNISQQVLKFSGKSFFFYGTSFCREFYFDMVKGLYNREELSWEEMFIPSYKTELTFGETCGSKSNEFLTEQYGKKACFKGPPGCNLPGKAGINPARCGWPYNRTEISNDISLHFQFKTYVSTPEHDSRVLKDLLSRNPDFLVVGSAEWGTNKYFTTPRNYTRQAAEFLDPIFTAYPGRKIFIYNNGYNKSSRYLRDHIQKLLDLGDTSAVIFDMGHIKSELNLKKVLPNGHGYSGPVTRAIVQSILDALLLME